MARQERDFYQRPLEDQRSFLQCTWCENCQEMDLGMTDPIEYEDEGVVIIEGKCKKCGEPIVTEVDETEDW